MRTTLNLDQFFLVLWQMKTSFSQRSWDPIRLKIIVVVNEGWKVLDISTRTLVGLPDLASDGSPLFAEPMFLFGWTLCNTSIYCMLTFWLSCENYALRGEFPLLHIPPAQQLCIVAVVVHCKELVKLSSPPLQFTFNKNKMKRFKKVKLVYLRMLVR